jgi:hypothetical protein
MRVPRKQSEDEWRRKIHEAHSACSDDGNVSRPSERRVRRIVFLEDAVSEWEA